MAQFQETLFDGPNQSSLWTAYSYAAAQQPSYLDEPTLVLPRAKPDVGQGLEDDHFTRDHLETGAPVGLFQDYYAESRDDYGLESYLDPPTLVRRPSSSSNNLFLHPPSPGIPPLSSADSTPSSSSALATPFGPFDASPPSAGGLLLPSALIGEPSSSSCFAKLQESYLEQREEQRADPFEPSSHALAFSSSAPPSTPRRHPSSEATQLWRSPSAHSVTSSPTKSPYAQRAKPYDRPFDSSPTKDHESPSKLVVRRNLPTPLQLQQDDLNSSPTKGGRRHRANLSIDVPSKYGLRSRLPVIAASPQVPANDGRFPVVDASVQGLGGPDLELTESTLRQVEDLLQEFGPMAPSGAFDGRSSAQSTGSLPLSRAPSSSTVSSDARYCISGVSLSLEDLAQLDDPSLTAAFDSVTMQPYPASAPPHQTTFNLPEPPSPSPYHLSVPNSLHTTPLPTPSPGYGHDSSSYTSQPIFERWSPSSYVASQSTSYNSHTRSLSAPRTAYYPTESDLASLPLRPPISHSLSATYSTHSLPSQQSTLGPPPIRRRSSVATGSPSSWSHAPPRPHQTLHSYSYGPPPASPSSAQDQHSPYHSIPLPLRPAPPLGTTYDVSPPTSPTKPKPRSKAPASTTSSPTKAGPSSPRKRKGGGPRAKNSSAMFVNFSAADAKKLLSGVAPSGSSRKKREEEEATAAAAKAAETEASSSAVSSDAPAA